MDEYIEREAAKDAVSEVYYDTPDVNLSAEKFEAAINSIPAADVAPVVHGRWECGKPCPVCGRDRFEGLDADIWADWEPPYCPNCGAKMGGGVDDACL